MIEIKPGSFMRGSDSTEAMEYEKPVHLVEVASFWIATVPVTQSLWEAVMGKNPSRFKLGKDYPVEQVGWNDVQRFLERLNEFTGERYRLPREAEWEYACRAGTAMDRYDSLDEIAWHPGNSGVSTHPVKGKRPNFFGLHDMLGNVFEWCEDWFWEYPAAEPLNLWGRSSEDTKVIRGGSWRADASWARSPARIGIDPYNTDDDQGFRLARDG